MRQQSNCEVLADDSSCGKVLGCRWNENSATCVQEPQRREEDRQLLDQIRVYGEIRVNTDIYTHFSYSDWTYNRFVRQDSGSGECVSCREDIVRSMSNLPVDRQVFVAYFIGRAMLSGFGETDHPPLPTASLDTWQDVTETVDSMFPVSETSQTQRISMSFFSTMVRFLTYGMLVTAAAAGQQKMTYCFSANDISYST